MLNSRFTYWLDGLLIALLAAALVWPLFTLHYLDNWGSIESTFIADGRFLKENGPLPGWQPLWYCGTRFDYIYPPTLRYGTAYLAALLSTDTFRSYHLYTAFFYCIGIAGVYLLARIGSGSRAAGWVAAIAAALVSPSFLFIGRVRVDALGDYLAPQRLHVLVRYGEGPHISALAMLGFALAFSYSALRGRRRGVLALAAVFSALVVSNNFYGATALAVLFPVLVWALWVTHWDHWIWIRATAIVVLSAGLTAFWLTPSYVSITLRNMRLVSEPGHEWSLLLVSAVVIVFGVSSLFLTRRRKELAYPLFVTGSLLLMGLNVLGHHYYQFRVIGEPMRLIPELDLVMILAAVECLRRLWLWRPREGPAWTPKVFTILLCLISLYPAHLYLAHAWEIYPSDPDFRQRVEYKLTKWTAENMPESRVLATGSMRFWYNAWHDLAQVGGGSEQGLLNMTVYWAVQVNRWTRDAETAILWLQAAGADAAIIHGEESQEIYHDVVYPDKFDGVLPVLYDNREGDVIYRVPRRFPGLSRVVELEQVRSLLPIRSPEDLERLRSYVEVVERGPDKQAYWSRVDTDRIQVRANLQEGEAILLQESYDPAWKAYSGNRQLPIEKDAMGFMLIEAPPGNRVVRIIFELPLENFFGRIVSILSALIVIRLLVTAIRQKDFKAWETR